MLIRIYNEFLKDYFENKSVIGVEIGTRYGDNAKEILSLNCVKKLYCIDPYKSNIRRNIELNERIYTQVKRRFHKEIKDGRLEIIRDLSHNSVNKIPDDLDFVYIDGDHSYDAVKMYIEDYYKKTKSRGIFGGHDYNRYHYPGVKISVDEFIEREKLKLWNPNYKELMYSFINKSPSFTKELMDERLKMRVKHSDWWVIKP
jgi:hypothetical protein